MENIKEIAEFWLSFEFLSKFKELGEKYFEEIKKEKEIKKNNNESTKDFRYSEKRS